MNRVAAIIAIALCAACTTEEDPGPQTPVSFGFPVAEPMLIDGAIGVDHDPAVQAGGAGGAICTSYDGRLFPWCYDEHNGTDYILVDGFETMDAGSTSVVAAAAGTVIEAHDGEYDRCRLDDGEVSCNGNPIIANRVVIEHESGIVTRYWHLKKDSVAVTVGQQVECGEHLGLIGSSGLSSLPHLHFELRVDGDVVDPYSGEHSQVESWWDDQGGPEDLPGPGCTQN